jgi:2-deoxy-D-gluconate 3-dehydrogenase
MQERRKPDGHRTRSAARFERQVAIVTGSGRGIVETLAAAGAVVVVADINLDEANKVAAQLNRKRPACAIAVHVDVADEKSSAAMVQRVIEHCRRVDILVNNAGIYPLSRLRDGRAEVWDRTLAVNLRGPHLCSVAAARQMIAAGNGGRIINISSINTVHTYVGVAHYDASKAGLNALTRAAALEFAPHAITVNTVAPGGVKTPGSLTIRREFGQGSVEAADEEFTRKMPLGRWAEPEDIGRAVWFLASDAAAYITGQVIFVDGGLMLSI